MRKYISLFFSVLLLLCACKKTPDGILDQKQMITALTDMHIVDGEIAQVPGIPDSIYRYGMAKYLAVFKKDNVDTAQFRKSFKYYTLHPTQLVTIYDSVINRLVKKTDSLNKVVAKNNLKKAKEKPKKLPAGRPGALTPNAPVPASSTTVPNPVTPLTPQQQAAQRNMHRLLTQKHLNPKPNAVPAK